MINNNLELHNINREDEIDLRELFKTIAKNKIFILGFSLIITLLSIVYLHFTSPIFKSSTTIEIEKTSFNKNNQARQKISLQALAFGSGASGNNNLNIDIAIMKTFNLNKKVLKKINFNSRFYTVDNLKKIEIYNPNINVKINSINKRYQNIEIFFIPINNEAFELYQYSSILENKKIGKFKFNTNIDIEYFNIKINKKNNFNLNNKYLIKLNSDNRSIFNSIKNNLSLIAEKDTNFIEISFEDNIPERGEEYIKYLIYYYKQYFFKKEESSINNKIEVQKRQLNLLDKNLNESSKNLKNYEIKNNIIQAGIQITNLLGKIEELENTYIDTIFKKNMVINLIKFVKKNKNIGAISLSLDELGDKSTILLVTKLEELKLEKSTLKLDYKNEHPLVIKNINKSKLIKNQILANLKSLKLNIKVKIDNLLKLKNKLEKKASNFPKEKQELLLFNRDYQMSIQMSSLVYKNIASLEVDRWNLSLVFRTIEDIYTEPGAIKPKKKLIVVVTFITSLILSIFLVFFLEFIRDEKIEIK